MEKKITMKKKTCLRFLGARKKEKKTTQFKKKRSRRGSAFITGPSIPPPP
jgi:hypothetical protein